MFWPQPGFTSGIRGTCRTVWALSPQCLGFTHQACRSELRLYRTASCPTIHSTDHCWGQPLCMGLWGLLGLGTRSPKEKKSFVFGGVFGGATPPTAPKGQMVLDSKACWLPAVWVLDCHWTSLSYIFNCQKEIFTENLTRLL